VFMSWGALCWLPDMDELARLVAANLAPGGVFYVVDGHPMAGAADEDWSPADGVVRLKWNYQTGRRPDTAIWNNDYAGSNSAAPGLPAHEWAHGLGRIVTALTAAGLVIDFLHEHDVAAWRCMRGLEPATDHMWRLPAGVAQMPLSFSLLARKP
ncbi:MAG: SAM-dependent methyltransferase, partial [Alphaproteobacteria bacterium]